MAIRLTATTPPERYAMAVAALYAQTWGGLSDDANERLDSPTCFEQVGFPGVFRFLRRRGIRRGLLGFWSITDASSLLETVRRLRAVGGRGEYDELKAAMQEHGWLETGNQTPLDEAAQILMEEAEDEDDEESEEDEEDEASEDDEEDADDEDAEHHELAPLIVKMSLIREHGTRLAHGILGWDMMRASQVILWGVEAGWLNSAPLAWRELFLNAQQAQGAFRSWKEIADSFLVGRAFWLAGEPDEMGGDEIFASATRTLLSHPQSPWTRLAWDLPLGR